MHKTEKKGRILYVGASYYNNWYLSRALRDLGWNADLLVYAAESTELYLHGYDFSLKEHIASDYKHHHHLFNFLRYWLRRTSTKLNARTTRIVRDATLFSRMAGTVFGMFSVRRFNLIASALNLLFRTIRIELLGLLSVQIFYIAENVIC